MKLWYRLSNVIHTEGIRTGLTVKYLHLTFIMKNKVKRTSIPLWILSYNRKVGLQVREMSERLEKLRNSGDL